MSEANAKLVIPRVRSRWLSVVLLSGLVISSCLAVRIWLGSTTASAQSTRSRASTSKASKSRTNEARSGKAATNAAVAVVNGEQITHSELARECLRRHGRVILESEINKHLVRQQCKQRGINITPQDVENEIKRMAAKFGMSPNNLFSLLKDEKDITPDQYRNEIWIILALRQMATDQLQVTRKQLDDAVESEFGPRVQVRMISASTASKAQELLRKVNANPDAFDTLAQDESEDINSAAARGLIPPVRRHVGDPQVEEAVFALREGEISPIVQASGQYLIFKCERHIPATKLSDQDRKRVEEQIGEKIREQNLRTVSAKLFKKMQSEAKVINVYNDPKLSKTMKGVAATINGQALSINQLASRCLARHGKEVLDGEINRKLLLQALRKRNLRVTEEDIDAEISRAAKSFGYSDRDAWLKYVTSEEEVTVDLYVRDSVWPTVALKKLVQSHVQVTDEDLQKGFVANYGERVRVLAIVVGNRHTANKVWELARQDSSADYFGRLANQYSIEPISKANFGEVPPVAQFSGQPLVEKEAFRLKEAAEQSGADVIDDRRALSGILSVGDKYVILRYLGTTRPVVDKLDDVRDELLTHLREEKLRVAMAQQFDELREGAQIDNILAGKSQTGTRSPRAALAKLQPGSKARRTQETGQAVRNANRRSSRRVQ